LKLWCYFL